MQNDVFIPVADTVKRPAELFLKEQNYFTVMDESIVFNVIDHVRNTPLCLPVKAYSTHSAMFWAWSPMRS